MDSCHQVLYKNKTVCEQTSLNGSSITHFSEISSLYKYIYNTWIIYFYILGNICQIDTPTVNLKDMGLLDEIKDLNTSISTEIINPQNTTTYEGWNFNSGNYLFTTDTK